VTRVGAGWTGRARPLPIPRRGARGTIRAASHDRASSYCDRYRPIVHQREATKEEPITALVGLPAVREQYDVVRLDGEGKLVDF
jgi:hypothetical protein